MYFDFFNMLVERTPFRYEKPIEMLSNNRLTKLCAPMVRYSKLPFRTLVRRNGCDLAFTPMIVCDSFLASEKARDNEFTTNNNDRPLVVQFAARTAKNLADASEIVCRNSDGVDLNCGCPQRWAVAEGYGACLLNNPQLLYDMVHQVRNRIVEQDFSVSLKIRIHTDIRYTVDLCRRAEKAGASWITVHGRTPFQRTEPVDYEAIRIINDSVAIPVVGNGDIYSLKDAMELHRKTGVAGVMSARGILQNPALFLGTEQTPHHCVLDWLNISLSLGTSFSTFHQHLMFMLEKVMPRADRRFFNTLCSKSAVLDFLQQYTED